MAANFGQNVKCDYHTGEWVSLPPPCEKMVSCSGAIPRDIPMGKVTENYNPDNFIQYLPGASFTYTCTKEDWYFDFHTDPSKESFAETWNVNNFTLTCGSDE